MAFEFHLPDIGEGVVEGEIVEWKVAEGDSVDLDQPLVEVQTDKATVEIPSPRKGTITRINFQAGEICPVGHVLVVIDDGAAAAAAAAPAKANGNGAGTIPAAPEPARSNRPEVIDATGATRRVLATPATRRLARKLGVDIAAVRASGRRGRVTSDDVRHFHQPAAPAAMATTAPQATGVPPSRTQQAPAGASGPEERIPFRGVRRKIAENMVRSKFTATHFTYVEEVDVTDLVNLRERIRPQAQARGIKLTYLPFIVKAICAGLKKWPSLNASLDEDRGEIVQKFYYHIGLAVQGPEGLMVSVVRDADRLSIFQLAQEIQQLGEAVQSGSVRRDQLVGSTFTVSSLGTLGGVLATPIINFPEVGIVGVHKIAQRPAVVADAIVPRWLMNLSISLDHRVVDGWDGAMFLQDVKSWLEEPTMMFMEMV
jgi:pyruvate dehydrogenase E2 component (dihydrolipoamide acetyltransferase)